MRYHCATSATSSILAHLTTAAATNLEVRSGHASIQAIPERKVEGLTSAAAIWCTATLGAAAGCGLWPTALLGTLFVVVVLSLVRRLERLAGRRTRRANGPRPRRSTPKYSSDSAAPESESR